MNLHVRWSLKPRSKIRPTAYAPAYSPKTEVVLDPNATRARRTDSAVVEFAGAEKVWKVVDGQAVEQAVQVGRRSDHEMGNPAAGSSQVT